MRKRGLLFHAIIGPERAHLRWRTPTAARKSAHRPGRRQPSRARPAVGFRRSLQTLRCRANLPRRRSATAASLKAADEAGLARGMIETVAPDETTIAIVADELDKMPA